MDNILNKDKISITDFFFSFWIQNSSTWQYPLPPNKSMRQMRCTCAGLGFILFYCIVYFFLGPHLLHMEVPGLGVES